MVAGLLMLKHMEGLSDERLLQAWVTNPYFQYFCGEIHFQHRAPVDRTTLIRWRRRLGEEGLEWLLSSVLSSAVKMQAVKEESFAHCCVDSTVMEKNIAFPTDSALLLKLLEKMISLMKCHNLSIRQSYSRTAPRLTQQIARYAHAKQYKRMRRSLKKLLTWTGRVKRELHRQLDKLDPLARELAEVYIAQFETLRTQVKNPKTKNKLYSLHEPEVDCISKGKAYKRYEFGVKVGIVCTQKEGLVTGIRSYPDNPYDGHTLDDLLQQSETLSTVTPKTVAVDLGYRGQHSTKARVIHRGRKLCKREKKRLKRRSMLEAMIGHMKNDGLLERCYLKGKTGDALHAILCGIGHNLRWLLNYIKDVYFLYLLFQGFRGQKSARPAEFTFVKEQLSF
jgi:IS5 family transposase